MTWDDLLASQDDAAGQGSDDSSDAALDDEDLAPLSDEEKQEALSLIAEIGNMEITETTKEELAEYADDIDQGEFEVMDLRYLRALKARLTA